MRSSGDAGLVGLVPCHQHCTLMRIGYVVVVVCGVWCVRVCVRSSGDAGLVGLVPCHQHCTLMRIGYVVVVVCGVWCVVCGDLRSVRPVVC